MDTEPTLRQILASLGIESSTVVAKRSRFERLEKAGQRAANFLGVHVIELFADEAEAAIATYFKNAAGDRAIELALAAEI